MRFIAAQSHRQIKSFCLALCAVWLCVAPLYAQTSGPSGLPLPRFVSLGSSKINVRHGPGQKYQIAWIFTQSGLPVEVIQEFDTWRKVRDSEGDEGWIHQSLLSGRRTGLIAPWLNAQSQAIPLYARADRGAPLRAQLAPQVLVTVEECDQSWCEVAGRFQPGEDDRQQNFKGWVEKQFVWGVYSDETFD
ncbi:SH3 domain-containing protein [Maritalea myrionectae]|uniref:Aspartate--tRNA ligase n=1 Tax=Maritalea myrionectae TaxID=454601 RepID=A0A2R4M9V9_9HYPH|nr:SH3 domain-containing protein [Maritalea myrionectae]AVX02745.1 aspartate--tRNA ligase [Maritalea myrionectae]